MGDGDVPARLAHDVEPNRERRPWTERHRADGNRADLSGRRRGDDEAHGDGCRHKTKTSKTHHATFLATASDPLGPLLSLDGDLAGSGFTTPPSLSQTGVNVSCDVARAVSRSGRDLAE